MPSAIGLAVLTLAMLFGVTPSTVRAQAAGSATLSTPVASGTVKGRLTEQGSDAIVAGAIAILVNEGGGRWPALAGDDGRFEIHAPPGRYRLRVERVGYLGFLAPNAIDLAAGVTIELDIEVPSTRMQLQTVRVTGSTACESHPERGRETAAVWGQARAALDNATLTAKRGLLPLDMTLRRDVLDARGRLWARDESSTRTRLGHGFVAETWDLLRTGFAEKTRDSTRWYGPDADLLLSPTFLETHCFSVVRRRTLLLGRRVGLAFRPTPGRNVVEIEGTFWLDEKSAELRTIEYHYVVPGWPSDIEPASGEISLSRAPRGMWIVDRFSILLPQLAWRPPLIGSDADSSAPPLNNYVTAFVRREGRLRVLAREDEVPPTPAFVRGTVYDSLLQAPLADVRVSVNGDPVARTDSLGRYMVRLTRTGSDSLSVVLGFEHERLALLRLGAPSLFAVVAPGDTAVADFAVPTPTTLLQTLCPVAEGVAAAQGMVVGAVQRGGSTGDAAMVADRPVRLVRRLGGTRGRIEEIREWRTDADGAFLLCGVLPGEEMQLEVDVGPSPGLRHPITVPVTGVRLVQLVLP